MLNLGLIDSLLKFNFILKRLMKIKISFLSCIFLNYTIFSWLDQRAMCFIWGACYLSLSGFARKPVTKRPAPKPQA
jgi:hypothetical protein